MKSGARRTGDGGVHPVLTRLCFPFLFLGAVSPVWAQDWYRGNTHAHSLWSDGDDFPEMIMDWYKANGYQFAALSDHNILATKEKWMALETIEKRQRTVGRRAIDKYRHRFGEAWLETRETEGVPEVRLKRLEEYRGFFEEPGRFLILPAEEISNTVQGRPVHVNAVNIPGTEPIPAVKDGTSVPDVIRENLRQLAERERQTGQPAFAHLNHPNFQWGVTAAELAEVIEERFFEVYNGHPGIRHLGDEEHPGDEEIWDLANTLRLSQLDAAPLFGLATDDSHTYHGGLVSPGRGWIMVRSASLSADALVTAIRAGDFYASSGVFLEEIAYDTGTRTLRLRIRPDGDVRFTTRWIGTRRNGDTTGPIGEIFAESAGTEIEFQVPPDALYARARIDSDRDHSNPSYAEQKEQAWTQPVGWQPGG